MLKLNLRLAVLLVVWWGWAGVVAAEDTVKIGLNYPQTGPYAVEGQEQLQAAQMAIEEINKEGGVLGKQIKLVTRNTCSQVDISIKNATELIDQEKVQMVFSGDSSAVVIVAGRVCQEKNIPFFGTMTYSAETTGKDGHRCVFRECYDSEMAARVIGTYLKETFPNKKYFYITANYNWGHSTENAMRKITGTGNTQNHKRMLIPFPNATYEDYKNAVFSARRAKPEVLVIVLFGQDMVITLREAHAQGLKENTQIVVPNLTLSMAEGCGPNVMEAIIGALPWCWQVPYKYDYARGKQFVEDYATRFNHYPCTPGASAYTVMYEYKAAVERAGTFDTIAVIKALEGHEYTFLKDQQQWRDFDHQSLQTVYAVVCKPRAEVLKDKLQLDYFDIIHSLPGDQAAISLEQWTAARKAAQRPSQLEPLPDELTQQNTTQTK